MRNGIVSFLAGGAIGAVCMWAAPSLALQSHQDVKTTVQSYLHDTTNGQQNHALSLLTGEAKVIVSAQPKVIPDPLVKDDLKVVTETNDLAEVDATIWTKSNRMEEQFYLLKQSSAWAIYHVELSPESFAGLKSTKLTDDQQKPIKSYVDLIAKGDVKKANQFLIGNAAIQADKMNASQIPKRVIELSNSMKTMGVLPNGDVLVETQETIKGTVDQTETILYAVSQVPDGSWKISDVKLLERS